MKNILFLILLCLGLNGFSQECEELKTQLTKLNKHKEVLEKDLAETNSKVKEIELRIEQIGLQSINANKFVCNSTTTTISRFKSTPELNGQVIELIPKKKVVKVLEYVGDSYWKISYNDQIGYLNDVLIKETSEMVLVKKTSKRQVKPFKTKNTKSYSTGGSSYRTIHTGPRGGRYYINSNGNKTYIKRK
ncbi:SH3 domain-containing protein [Ancylomarina salipaludis]|uniref:SH3 domain-containing protein n=1 Tax=Ancylomarina salipaludis TaxID=2501299 RepID=A0A4Q1JI78_9BACT|nr:SH3 domain-containing protein [Ancylomarina salipaludis]RXQ87826.1 SH3 domain-containing protein [Ancylomarina salipaludis]